MLILTSYFLDQVSACCFLLFGSSDRWYAVFTLYLNNDLVTCLILVHIFYGVIALILLLCHICPVQHYTLSDDLLKCIQHIFRSLSSSWFLSCEDPIITLSIIHVSSLSNTTKQSKWWLFETYRAHFSTISYFKIALSMRLNYLGL